MAETDMKRKSVTSLLRRKKSAGTEQKRDLSKNKWWIQRSYVEDGNQSMVHVYKCIKVL